MSELKEIENRILEIKQLINDIPKSISFNTVVAKEFLDARIAKERKPLEEELGILETRRQFILDRRESLLWKLLWNIIVPVAVSIGTTYLSIKLGIIRLP